MISRMRPALALATMLGGPVLSGCSWAPGPALDVSRLNDDIHARTGAETYPVKLITADVVKGQIDAVAASSSVDSPSRAGAAGQEIKGYRYRIGPQDLIGVTVLYHPQLSSFSSPASLGQQTLQAGSNSPVVPLDQSGFLVNKEGDIYYPPVGKLRVAGKTIDQVREMIAQSLRKEVRDPRVDVRVLAYRNGSVDVTGLVRNPGTLPITDVPLTMMNVIARSGGTLPDADVQRVRLLRDGKSYEFDLDSLIEKRDGGQDFLLRAGDIVNVPDQFTSRVFVLGEVAKPTSLQMHKGRLTLADALAGVNSIDVRAADPRQVFVIRGMRENRTRPNVFRLDMTQVDAILLSTQFRLEPLDVVYVGTSDAVRFNRVLDQITPTIQTLFFTTEMVRRN